RRLVALARLDLFAVHDATLVFDREPGGSEDPADYGREDHRPRAAALQRDVRQLRLLPQGLTDADGTVKAERLPREHPAGQRHVRHDDAPRRRAVGPQLARGDPGREVDDVPARWQRVAVLEFGLGPAECEPQQVRLRGGDDVGRGLGAADVTL